VSPKNVTLNIVHIFADYQQIFKKFYWHILYTVSNKAIIEYLTTH